VNSTTIFAYLIALGGFIGLLSSLNVFDVLIIWIFSYILLRMNKHFEYQNQINLKLEQYLALNSELQRKIVAYSTRVIEKKSLEKEENEV
jgi:hypothetical protein